jgi:TPR repeat protein
MAVKAVRRLLLAGLLGLTLTSPASADLAGGLAAYESGDYLAAYRELRTLAELGDPAAQHILARMYFSGQGVPRDAQQGLGWERKAAERGDAQAQLDLAMRYHYEIDVPKDIAEAAKWYRLAAEQNLAVAQYRLGLLILNELGEPRDLIEAHLWLNLAAAKLPPGEIRTSVVTTREALAAKMTTAQIKEAQKLARDWQPKPWSQLAAPRPLP